MSAELFSEGYKIFSLPILIILGVFAILCLLRAVIGPKPADRVVATNMMGTVIMAMIIVLAVRLKEGYLADISLIYALISFLAVIVLCKIYAGAFYFRKKKHEQEAKENGDD